MKVFNCICYLLTLFLLNKTLRCTVCNSFSSSLKLHDKYLQQCLAAATFYQSWHCFLCILVSLFPVDKQLRYISSWVQYTHSLVLLLQNNDSVKDIYITLGVWSCSLYIIRFNCLTISWLNLVHGNCSLLPKKDDS